jgi:hypothetical protein
MTTLALAALLSGLAAAPLHADDAVSTSVADLYKDKSSLGGRQVNVQGKVVKVNNHIMQRNFIHIQDGTGNAADGTNDLTITTQDDVAVGDQVSASGTLLLDQDFGFGYRYSLLLEQARVTKAR